VKDLSNKNLNEPAWPAKAVKPQSVKNTMGHPVNSFTPGKAPSGGFTSVWDFSGRPNDSKNSPVSKPEKGGV
jgi:hypothetical protein